MNAFDTWERLAGIFVIAGLAASILSANKDDSAWHRFMSAAMSFVADVSFILLAGALIGMCWTVGR